MLHHSHIFPVFTIFNLNLADFRNKMAQVCNNGGYHTSQIVSQVTYHSLWRCGLYGRHADACWYFHVTSRTELHERAFLDFCSVLSPKTILSRAKHIILPRERIIYFPCLSEHYILALLLGYMYITNVLGGEHDVRANVYSMYIQPPLLQALDCERKKLKF